jgi:circadian clock protein KaiC
MLGGEGYYRGSSVLVSGTAGTGKTSLTAHLVDATCRRGERCLVFLFEESPSQLMRNMRSIGIDLQKWVDKGLLRMHAARPTLHGFEAHLVSMHKMTEDFEPSVVAMDPVTNLATAGTLLEAKQMLTRLIDYFKTKKITTFFTSLTQGDQGQESTDVGISSLMDTWLLVRDLESNGERNRVLYVLKSRGMAHSNQVREFRLTGKGIDLVDVYVGPGGVLTGTARIAQEAREKSEGRLRQEEFQRRRSELDRKAKLVQAQLDNLAFELEATGQEREKIATEEAARTQALVEDRTVMARARRADPVVSGRTAPRTDGTKGA